MVTEASVTKAHGPRDWPDHVREPLERVGITPYETVETIRPKIAALGLAIVAMGPYRAGLLATEPLYYAAVIDPNDDESIRGEYWSPTDYAEALAWATSRVLADREERRRYREERLASTEPDEYHLIDEFGGSVSGAIAHGTKNPLITSANEFAAHVRVGDEVVAVVATPFIRVLPVWTTEREARFRASLRQLAATCDLRGRRGMVSLVVDPGTTLEVTETIDRDDALPEA